MIECSSCHTLNPEGEARCLLCRAELAVPQAASAGARCAAGHPIDPAWRTCPYCERQGRAARQPTPPWPGGASRPTHIEELPTAQQVREPSGTGPAPSGAVKATRLEGSASTPLPHPTVLAGAAAGARPGAPSLDPNRAGSRADGTDSTAAAGDTRPLVAVLAAPRLRAGGAVFAVRAGKNVLGASRTSDICLAEDELVSGEHAILLFRGGSFQLADRMSSNGTWLNDREIPANGAVEVRDRDRIRCGGVELVLLVIDAAVGAREGAGLPS